jgi:NO-binding membrane sensor protein with MHYT domain
MLPETYDPLFVALSYVVAGLGSYTALSLGARLLTRSGHLRVSWLLGGAAGQATGIWAMHFTGMLALHLPVPIGYDVPLVVLSYIIAFTGSLLALTLTQRDTLSPARVAFGGIFIGGAIAGLHYTDMAAMRTAARTVYYAPWVVLSIIIAIVFGVLSLWLARRYQRDDPRRPRWGKAIGAMLMGIAIVGQHYSGMAGVDFARVAPSTENSHITGPLLMHSDLRAAVVVCAVLVLASALITGGIDRRKSLRAEVSGRLLAAQESQRRAIAQVLHEDVGQLLTAVRLNLQRITPGAQKTAVVEDSMSLVDSALTRIRELSLDLRPRVLDDLGLSAAVSWFATRHAERVGYDLTIEDNLGQERLPEAVETAAFRITQQALANVARHSRARHVNVGLALARREFSLRVTDDGVGFDVGAARARALAGESLGVLDMHETAALAGGVFSILSSAETGTTVDVRFPLRNQ